MNSLIVGIDPGWKTLGISVTNQNGKLLSVGFINPSKYLTSFTRKGPNGRLELESSEVREFLKAIEEVIIDAEKRDGGGISVEEDFYDTLVVIERFVKYQGVEVDPEIILMIIGILQQYFHGSRGTRIMLYRAIDWKPLIAKFLVKNVEGFSNPYPKFNKKFSVLAAETLAKSGGREEVLEEWKGNDHVADSVCLSFIGHASGIFKLNRG